VKKLPRGRHGLPREFVERNQRERLIAGLAAVLYEDGYERTTVAAIGRRAGVSKSDFYKHFDGKEACFLAAYDAAVTGIRERVAAACEEAADWTSGVREALAAVVDFLASEPAQARLVLVEGLRAGRGVCDRYQAAVQSFVPYLRQGAPQPVAGARPPAADEAVIGGIAALLTRRSFAGDGAAAEQFLPQVAEFALTPYLGAAEARRIISRP
jgi:AcrR family transcriptional regulator